jgi:hypothetical protein
MLVTQPCVSMVSNSSLNYNKYAKFLKIKLTLVPANTYIKNLLEK